MKARYEKLLFMRQMLQRMKNIMDNRGEPFSPEEMETVEDVETEEHFYLNFHQDIAGNLFGVKKSEKHKISDYYHSSNVSKF